MIILITFVPLATFVMFSQATYSVNEDDGSVLPVLNISKSSPDNITVQVYNTDMSATGK